MGSISGSKSTYGWFLRLNYSVQQSISKNQSTLRLSLQIYAGTDSSYNLYPESCYYVLQGSKSWNPYQYSNIGWYDLGKKTITVDHADDGTASVVLSAEWHSGFTSQWTPAKLTVSGTVNLPTIKRLSTLSVPTMTLGQAATLTVTQQNTAYTHKINLSWFGTTYSVAKQTADTSISYTPKLSLAKAIPRAASGTGTLTIVTYSGDTSLGSKSYSVQIKVPDSLAPTFSVVFSDAAGFQDTYGSLIQLQSTIRATVKASAQYGASPSSCSFQFTYPGIGGFSGGPAPITHAAFADGVAVCDLIPREGGELPYVLSVTDSRGLSAVKKGTLTVHSYQAPTVSSITAVRCDEDGTENVAGAYALVRFSATCYDLGGLNATSYSVHYRQQGASGWTTKKLSSLSGEYTVAGTAIIPAQQDVAYEVFARAADSISSGDSLAIVLPSARVIFRISPEVDAVSIGQYPTRSGTLIVGGVITELELPAKDKITLGGQRFPGSPSLTDTQKNQLISLVDDYRGIRDRFSYDYDAIRDIYAKESDAVDGTLYRINCGLFLQLLWMGRSAGDYPPLVDDNSVSPPLVAGEYDNAITKAFDWGFYFPFARHAAYGLKNSSGGYFGWKKPNEDSYKGSYSWNSHYSAAGDAADNYQIWDTFAYAADMAEELYRLGCEVPMAEIEVGDILFFRSASLSDGDSDLYETRAFRHISHAAMLYGWSSEDLPIFVEATALTPPIIRTSLSYSSDYDKARAANLMGRVCMVARHPAAYGKGGNVPKKITRM